MAKRKKLAHTTIINPTSPEPAKILELPNELLLLILLYTMEPDIFSLALTCRRLNQSAFGYLFFPPPSAPRFFFSPIRFGGGFPSLYVGHRNEFRTFEALRLAFFDKPIPRTIQAHFTSISFPSEARQAGLFFETSPSVEHISLCFHPAYHKVPTPAAARKTMEYLLKSLTRVRVHQRSFGLELSGTNIIVDDTAPSPSYNGILLRTPTELILKGTTFLFRHPFLYWTINSMEACRLSNLHLTNVGIGPYLNLITLDTLRELTVACSTVTQVELSAFLSRHDKIVTLFVHNIADIPDGDASSQTKANKAIAEGALPKVHTLRMPPKCLLSWLRASSSLRSLKVLHLEDQVSDSLLQDILHALATRSLTTPPHTLFLPLYELSKTSQWMDIPLEDRAEPHISGLLQLHATLNAYCEMPAEISERLASAVAMFPDVETLNIRWPGEGKIWHNGLRKLLREKCPQLTHTDFDNIRTPIGIAYDAQSK